MNRYQTFILTILSIASAAQCTTPDMPADPEHTLWYETPASAWEETLPLGNGRLGMMPDGGIARETIVLNEISMWSGSEADYANPDAAASLTEIRAMLIEGRNVEAQKMMYERFVPRKPTEGGTYGSYQTLGNLMIDHHFPSDAPASDYMRSLDLRTASAETSFMRDGISYTRRYHVAREDSDIILVEIGSSSDQGICLDVMLDRRHDATLTVTEDGMLKMSGELDSGSDAKGTCYTAYARVIAEGGETTAETGPDGIPQIKVTSAGKVWIMVSAATSYFMGEEHESAALKAISKPRNPKDIREMTRQSIRSHRELYDRAGISFISSRKEHREKHPESYLPTDRRLYRYAEGAKDNALAALYYHYGRYLLICSTRPGSLPPNLQGLWADTYQTPWNGDYHTNINVQMNHWIAEQGNLPELHLPLTELTLRLIPSGSKTAKDFYGPDAKGWVQHMMTNVWNFTAPGEHPSWGATNTGGAWLCAHLWEHYAYNPDMQYLERIYPALAGASRFFLSTMIHEPKNGYLVTGPSSSPENEFYCGTEKVSICMGPVMDTQLIRELFTNTITAAELIGTDSCASLSDSLKTALEQLAPHEISDEGYLMEWLEDYREADIHHRHVSHLYGLHPGNQISLSKTPELAEACRVTLDRRGDEATGWSRAWKMNFWARLGDGDRALKLFRSLLNPAYEDKDRTRHISGTYPNLFCSHPPFQIDGNFGGAAGIGEMLLQSHEGFINPLPALPSEWDEGRLWGFKVRGGSTVDLRWKDGKVTGMTVKDPVKE